MAHLIENMLSVKETPWHGLGRVLDNPPTAEEAIKLAGLDWSVSLEPLYVQQPDGTYTEAKQGRATVRSTDRKVLGVVGPVYRVLQNVDSFKWFDPFLQSGAATIETAGSLAGGTRVWVLARLNRNPSVIVPGDEVVKYLLLSNSHDGSLAVRTGFTPVRVVCNNTLTLAHASGQSQLVRIKHSSSMHGELQAVRDTINVIDARFEATAEQFRALASRGINARDVRRYVLRVLEVPEDKPADDISGKMRNTVMDILARVETAKGNDLPGVKGTLWACYNAVTEWLTHTRGHNQESRLNSLWFGDSERMNRRALDTALAMLSA